MLLRHLEGLTSQQLSFAVGVEKRPNHAPVNHHSLGPRRSNDAAPVLQQHLTQQMSCLCTLLSASPNTGLLSGCPADACDKGATCQLGDKQQQEVLQLLRIHGYRNSNVYPTFSNPEMKVGCDGR